MKTKVRRYLPYTLTLFIVALDQISKALIVHYIPEGRIGLSFFSSWLEIVHVRNDAVAFSIGTSLPITVKYILFVFLPLFVMAYLLYIVGARKFDSEFSYIEKWFIAGIAGGGIGNIIDRIFRHLRVVDFVSTDMNGFLGFSRFPTWNLADASVVVFVILLFFSFAFRKKNKEKKNG